MSSMDDLLYVTIPRPDKQIVQCAPSTKHILARRHVRIVAELRLRFQWKAMDLLESKHDLMYLVDNPDKKRFKLFSHEICQVGKFPQYKWSEPNPVEIVKRSNHNFRILYYVKTGELWSDDGLIGNWNKKCEDETEEKRLIQIMKNTSMLIKKFDEKGFLTTTVKNAEELFMSKREFMND